jgi:hypothetical protein
MPRRLSALILLLLALLATLALEQAFPELTGPVDEAHLLRPS